MKRLYFTLSNPESCKNVVAALRSAGIPERRLHAVASLAVPIEDVPGASLLQTSELAHGIERGLAMGGTAGLLGGMLAVAFPPPGVVGAAAWVAPVAVGGAALGALALGLISKDIHNKELAAFERDIAHGRILLMVDVPKEEVEQWKQLVVEHHPEAKISVAAPPAT